MRDVAKKFIPDRIKRTVRYSIFDGYAQKSYSQEGEDMILRRLFERRAKGFYVDVGAHHPKRFSNTFYFYKRGWSGINIDAMPGSMSLFKRLRPRDINLEVPVGLKDKILRYYMFNEPALNGFDPVLAQKRLIAEGGYKIVGEIDLHVRSLESVLDEYLPSNTSIAFLTIDVEGLDFEVVQSNNWKKYRPEVILIEVLSSSLEGLEGKEVHRYLAEQGYEVYAKAVNTVIYKLRAA